MNSKVMSIVILGMALVVPLTSSVTVISAQANRSERQSVAEPERVSDQELQAFAKSYVEFDKIRTASELQISAAKTPQEKSGIEQDAMVKLSATLEREGLTIARFRALFQTIDEDDQLREKVLKLIEDEQAKS